MHKFTLLFSLLLLTVQLTQAQVGTLTGKITTAQNQTTLPGVHIYLQGTNHGTVSNNQGQYSLTKLPVGKHQLVVTFSGFKRIQKEISITEGTNTCNFAMTESNNMLGEVVITGTGTSHHLRSAPVPTEVISKKAIESVAANNFSELMMSISPSFDFNPGTMGAFMTLNGLRNDFILVLIDGKRTYGDMGGNSDLNRINPDDVERIEIVKGASSLLYGSDAIAGVVNVITKKTRKAVQITNTTRLREHGTLQQNNSVAINLNRFSSHTSYSRKQSDGWQLSPYELDDDELIETEAKAQNQYDDYTIKQQLSYHATEKLTLHADVSFFERNMYRPQSVSKYGYYFNDLTYGAGAKYLLGKKDAITLNYHTDRYRYYYLYNQEYTDRSTDKTYNAGNTRFNSEQKLDNVQLKYVGHIAKNNILSVGAEYINESMASEGRVLGGEVDAYTAALFVQDELTLFNDLAIVAGARMVKHKEFGSAFTPKISVKYALGNFNLRSTYGYGFKTPTLKELYFHYEKRGKLYLGNTDLKPQTSQYISFGAEYSTGKFTVSANAYRNNVDDLIDYKEIELEPTDAEDGIKLRKKHFNIEETRSEGIDLLFDAQLGNGFAIGGGYSYVKAEDLTSGERLQGVAENYANARVSYNRTWGKYNFGAIVTARYQDEKYYENQNAKAYQLINISTSHKLLSFNDFMLELNLGVDNVLDYVDDTPFGGHYGTLSPGRTLFAGVRIHFSK